MIKESSPYLLQHAHNPVDWMAWDEAAFDRAKAENKPIFLSIGYATCHWCHVMEHESFEDLAVAEFLNQHFICIKVDREQHPVVDDFYMTALQLIAGQGGWPMSSFLTPDAEPFMAGTYFPQPRFLDLIQQIKSLWNEQQEKLTAQGQRVKKTVKRYLSVGVSESQVSIDWLNQASEQLCAELLNMHDGQNGGFGGAPKFPQEAWLQFLMYQYVDSCDEDVAVALKLTLKKMQQGGIHDHLAGGFHRYCVDEDWLVPHFEKMLYNQAQLLQLYAQAAVVFDEASFAETARQIVAFVSTEMLSAQGLFYSALDADSLNDRGELVEGAYYVWSWHELKGVLTETEFAWLSTHFAVFPGGNFEGQNVLFQRDLEVFEDQFPSIKNKLIAARASKARPLTDDKVIVSWNGMMIEALARAGVLLKDVGFISLAQSAYDHLWNLHWHEGQLRRVSQSGQRNSTQSVLSDYSNLAAAALALHDAVADESPRAYDEDAELLLSLIKEKFWYLGVLYQSEATGNAETMHAWQPQVVNAKDGATVSATAKMLQVISLSDQNHTQWFNQILAGHVASIAQQNTAHAGLLTAYLQSKSHTIGQKKINKEGIKITLINVENSWKVSIESLMPWTLQGVQLCNGEAVISPYSRDKNCFIVSPTLKRQPLLLSWQLCDDKQCLPPQSLKLYLY
nr:thioredoxin domain-containing protein [Marinicella rhabdoformis]